MQKLKLGMVGGGEGAFIGAVHRMAARLDGHWDLIAGCLSSTPAKAQRSADSIGLERSYRSFEEMAAMEGAREDGIDAVSIVTPNHMHLPIARAFLAAGIHVICDKPLTTDLARAQIFAKECDNYDARFFLTHNYSASPLIRQAKEMVANGDLGKIRLVHAEYLQDWLSRPADPDNVQAAWRTDPERTGGAGAIGDIGTHAYHLATFVVGENASHLSADLSSFVEGRQVDDNAHILLRFATGARGSIFASQVATGKENDLKLRIHGTKGGLLWEQENPNQLIYTPIGGTEQRITRAGVGAHDAANSVSRIPSGHPEGYLEAFATLYSDIARELTGETGAASDVPGLMDAMAGMRFIHACQKSSEANSSWRLL
ncbi:MAG: Gfo/Idh/MocA family oxidoreductase [Shimia sp.]|nr:Gfo/Idh/MocA family oxidoreductase [Shimia sp.]|mmetsp:Transcript_29516/g.57954  ORF Transcript_29516/g.57954 Transcript_29516/m.57954 type:complete len:372 (-) Transcript_29516:470-1585(-)